MEGLRENPMLTTASISIPQRSGNSFQPRIMADFSEFGLDTLDGSSLSPNLLQEVSLSGIPGVGHGQSNTVGYVNTSNLGDNTTLYENPNTSANSNTNTNTMWSDIGNAMITTKSEPFQMEDDYIFQIDKADLIQGPTLAELNDETLLEDLNIEDLIPAEHDNYLILPHGHHLLQLQNSSMNQSGNNQISSSSQQVFLDNHGNYHQQQSHINQQHHCSQTQPHHIQNQQNPNLHLQISTAAEHFYEENNTTGSSSPYDIYQTTPTKSLNSSAAFSPGSQTSSNSPQLISLTPPVNPSRNQFQHIIPHSGKIRSPALQDLLKKEYSMSPDRNLLGQSVPGPSSFMCGNTLSPTASSGFGSSAGRKVVGFSTATAMSRLSSSAPTHLGFDQIWQRREPRQHLLSTGSLAEAESFSSISTTSILSPEANDFSHDEGYSDYDSDRYEDCSSDNESGDDENLKIIGGNQSGKNKERYFWQYNVQAKGPKGQRLVIKTQLEDPHILNEVTDPVFSPNCSVRGIKVYKHSGKARKGDGNDLTPNPKKLHMIGKELDKLGRTINDMTPVSELPFNVRPKSRKEKNKLASRACRLKKKAQHEANKIKLYGLEIEHKKLLNGINDIKHVLAVKYQNVNENSDDLNQQLDQIVKASTKIKIAGCSTEFVNKILEKVKAGVPNGGLEDLKNT